MHDENKEQQLVERAQGGDRQAFEELCVDLRASLLAAVQGRLGPAASQGTDAEDVVQTSLARALQSIQRFEWRGGGSFHRWLKSIAIHVALDAVRHKGRRTILKIDRDVEGDGSSPSKGIRRQERTSRLEAAMKSLSPDYRTVLKLSRMDGLPIKEVARQMDRTQSAVKNLLLRATKQLRQSFGDTESLNLGEEHFEDSRTTDGQ